jgi:hypothetical protein
MAATKKLNKKTLSGSLGPIEHVGKKTTQGNGSRSKPKKNRKKYKGQGK